jgi:hypothetical protein
MSRTHDVTISAFDLDRLEAELTAVTEQRDRLAEAVSRIANNRVQDTPETDYAYEFGRMEGIAKIALAAVKSQPTKS